MASTSEGSSNQTPSSADHLANNHYGQNFRFPSHSELAGGGLTLFARVEVSSWLKRFDWWRQIKGIDDTQALNFMKGFCTDTIVAGEVERFTTSAKTWDEQKERLLVAYRPWDHLQAYTPEQERLNIINNRFITDAASLWSFIVDYDNALTRLKIRDSQPVAEAWMKLPSTWIKRLRADHGVTAESVSDKKWPYLMEKLLEVHREALQEETQDQLASGATNLQLHQQAQFQGPPMPPPQPVLDQTRPVPVPHPMHSAPSQPMNPSGQAVGPSYYQPPQQSTRDWQAQPEPTKQILKAEPAQKSDQGYNQLASMMEQLRIDQIAMAKSLKLQTDALRQTRDVSYDQTKALQEISQLIRRPQTVSARNPPQGNANSLQMGVTYTSPEDEGEQYSEAWRAEINEILKKDGTLRRCYGLSYGQVMSARDNPKGGMIRLILGLCEDQRLKGVEDPWISRYVSLVQEDEKWRGDPEMAKNKTLWEETDPVPRRNNQYRTNNIEILSNAASMLWVLGLSKPR
ncbi:hypothetical protein M406DRAFT_329298 [Cryphonectria parasitica EP155]|uniref:Uncharacterized protein n=1 Tax=Cryphonectria parasitica (strain ATCC 38755 / EP155) TaxID=660469 RepID=A0A9P5CJE8_CRYP1|nr:uncharacterized protein M406DRAFT_334808 [Cryphonectria parasitica EP155]XP_040771665.1 uncharacterized protein M406DRAFT_334312 [Cryphonectria parasitica EP155]XP_040772188.1 uncharacterized protein M406DRAFT_334807 [Cryphonectria parasitica EP155]XP_040774672.1 uncharacterized protein M406DRAFT_332170 [Cryphonectria parasitica EP155]XP_040776349.1 uncharacterized protein M406DRAFT_329298 [Cryphonectria parasitica EP155]KAF3760128.1 hypothetical protein M406DRAFT_334808 [Cryphonectria para